MTASRERGRSLNGLLLLDKPIGLTSNRALQEVKKLLNAKKAGHTGSLDPLATGLLPICLGEATKYSHWLLDSDKSYETTAKLGVITDSGDAEGKVIEQRELGVITEEQILGVIEKFRGEQLQVPPMYSALKKAGKPLYELARQGLEVERKPRPITVFELELRQFCGDELQLSTRVTKGTYIRSLVEDIGKALGCGAHVKTLRRTAVGDFSHDKMISLEALKKKLALGGEGALDEILLPVDALLSSLPRLELSEKEAHDVHRGKRVIINELSKDLKTRDVRLYNHEQVFIGVGILDETGVLKAKRLMSEQYSG